MEEKRIRILLVEDDPGDARMLRERLTATGLARSELVHVQRLTEALTCLDEQRFAVVLLDLLLPDSEGLETVVRVSEHAPQTPIIVLTVTDDERTGARAVQSGAQDYLVKDQTDSNLLQRSIRYTIKRHRLQMELKKSRQRESQQRELRSMAKLSEQAQTEVTARSLGATALREAMPDLFTDLVHSYGGVLDVALEQRIYRIGDAVPEGLRSLGERLGYLRAGPRDVVEVHVAALAQKMRKEPGAKVEGYVEEGRLAVLQLMGYVLSHYRNHVPGCQPDIKTQPDQSKTGENDGDDRPPNE